MKPSSNPMVIAPRPGRALHSVADVGGDLPPGALRLTLGERPKPKPAADRLLQFAPLTDWQAELVLVALDDSTSATVKEIAAEMRERVRIYRDHPAYGDDPDSCDPFGMPRP